MATFTLLRISQFHSSHPTLRGVLDFVGTPRRRDYFGFKKKGLGSRLLLFYSFTLSLLFTLLPLTASKAWASEEFETSYQVRYEVGQTGRTTVTYQISLTNKLSRLYAASYSLNITNGRLENILARDNQGPLKFETNQENDSTRIDLFFNQTVVGKGKTLSFDLSYEVLDLAVKNGQIWEVSVPKLAEAASIENYQLTLVIPLEFGEPAFISPSPLKQSQEENFNLFLFNRDQVANLGVKAAFGEFQIFDFILNYHLENPGRSPNLVEIALPPDTSYQQVSYRDITPVPSGIWLDPDGNWLAKYRLKPTEKVNVMAAGKARIFSQPSGNFLPPTQESLEQNLLPQKYWETQHSEIKKIGLGLKTPENIYQYVIDRLDYDFSRVKKGAVRFGAHQALKNPSKAICTEFTDLFITLTRAAGVPAREINGYAHTTNPKLKPLSLVADVLHAWPEYWDKTRKVWIPVDPTWGETTGGFDYFHKPDINRLVFAIHGASSERPFPAGSYKVESGPGKDVQVVFGEYTPDSPSDPEVKFDLPQEIFKLVPSQGKIIIRNSGPRALYDLKIKLLTSRLKLASPNWAEKTIAVLLPYSQIEIPISLQAASLMAQQEGTVSVVVGNNMYSRKIQIGSLWIRLGLPLAGFCLAALGLFMIKRRQRNVA